MYITLLYAAHSYKAYSLHLASNKLLTKQKSTEKLRPESFLYLPLFLTESLMQLKHVYRRKTSAAFNVREETKEKVRLLQPCPVYCIKVKQIIMEQ